LKRKGQGSGLLPLDLLAGGGVHFSGNRRKKRWHERGEQKKQNAKDKKTTKIADVGVSLNATLANPKSQIFSLQFALARMFFGLRSQ
jgi:hypothetical protein